MAIFTVTNTGSSGTGSLHQAISDAETAAGDDVITFAASLIGSTITVASDLEIISGDGLTIDGDLNDDRIADITISGDANLSGSNDSGDTTIFDIQSGGVAMLDGLILRGGRGEGTAGSHVPDSLNLPGGDAGGAIVNAGTLTLRNSLITDSYAVGGMGIEGIDVITGLDHRGSAGGSAAGGILNSGALTLIDTILDGNTAIGGVGGRGGEGIDGFFLVSAGGDGGPGGNGGDAAGSILNLSSGTITLHHATLGAASIAGGTGGRGGAGGPGYFQPFSPFIEFPDGNGGPGGDGGDTSAHILNFGTVLSGDALIAGALDNTPGSGGAGGTGGDGFGSLDGPDGDDGTAGALVVDKDSGTGTLDLAIETSSTGITDGQDGDDIISGDGPVEYATPYSGEAGTLVKDGTTGNGSFGTALVITQGDFGFGDDANVQNAASDVHVTVDATGSGQIDYYRFTVEERGAVVLDIDDTPVDALDTVLTLFDAGGTFIARNDDDGTDPGSTGIGTNPGSDSRLDVDLAAGDYVLQVANRGVTPITPAMTYGLSISLPPHTLALVDFFAGEDTLNGGPGNDRLFGMTDYDILNGGDGDDALFGGQADDTLNGGAGDDRLDGGIGRDILNGGAGIDTAVYENAVSAVHANLTASGVIGEATGDTYRDVENLIGSAFDDTLIGDFQDNVLSGGAGADLLLGGLGTDTAAYRLSPEGVIVNLASSRGFGGDAEGDILSAIENLIGSTHDDLLVGGYGDDTLRGGFGADALNGGVGFDTADYSDSAVAVDARLHTTGLGGTAEGDTLTYIEAIIGSDFGDTLVGAGTFPVIRLDGGDGDDLLFDYGNKGRLNGGAGRDTMIGGSGADDFDGGAEADTVRFANAAGAVTVDLMLGTGLGADAEGDTFVNVENLVGSGFADTLSGDDTDNRLEGGAGADRLTGRGGVDLLFGGMGLDTFVFDTTDWGDDLIFDFDPMQELLDISAIGLSFDSFSVIDTAFGVRLDYIDPTHGLQTIGLGGVTIADIDAGDFIV